jgi:LuxR family maltose regulon positive regulatory protein
MQTKLHAPTPRRVWVERAQLTRYLAGTTARLVLVDAPAGSGKTTMVAQWRSSAGEGRRFAWVSLERGDDPGRLWRQVVSALQRACPEIDGNAILRALRAQAQDVAGSVLPFLLNELAALSAPVVLVLDDYHEIKNDSCHDQIAFLLHHLPPSAQIVLITRADPPLPLARLRAAGEMVEIRQRELRFTLADTAALVHAVAGIQLTEPDLADLVARTEGWPTGVYLAALSLRGHPSPEAFVRQFADQNRFVVDFLAEEILSRQPGEIQQFLMRTSILTRFCAPLCDAVTGSAGAADIIEMLDRENLFLVPLDDNRQWYRYHHLFAQLLRSQLARTEPGVAAALHKRASAWHRVSGSIEEAVSHALAADDVAGAVDLIARDWYAYADAGRIATVRGLIRSLGDDRIAASPVAAHCAAWIATFSGDRDSVLRWLPVAEAGHHAGPLPDGMRSLRSSAALLRGICGFDGLRVMRESAATAVELECDPASPWYAMARSGLGFSLYLSGEPEAAAASLREAAQSHASYPLTRMFSLSVLSLVAVQLGRLPEAQEAADAARVLAARDGLDEAPQGSLAYTATGAVHATHGYLEVARSYLEHALRVRRNLSGISPWHTFEPTLLLARVLLDLGDRAGAAELADKARDILTALPDGAEAQQARLAELYLWIAGLRQRVLPLATPLTEREVAVLRLLRGTLSLRGIGQELYVSANTIKTHTQAIYRKLGVSTRREAVQRAEQTGILRLRLASDPAVGVDLDRRRAGVGPPVRHRHHTRVHQFQTLEVPGKLLGAAQMVGHRTAGVVASLGLVERLVRVGAVVEREITTGWQAGQQAAHDGVRFLVGEMAHDPHQHEGDGLGEIQQACGGVQDRGRIPDVGVKVFG